MAGHIKDSTSVDWNTPKWLVDHVQAALGLIALDPCSNPHSIVPAIYKVQLPEDGLKVDWTEYSTVYVNPPYGRGIYNWIEKAADAGDCDSRVIMVIPAAVDTKHWHNIVWPRAAAVCFLSGRVKFDLPDKVCQHCDGAGTVSAATDNPEDYDVCSNCAGERMVPQGGASSTVPTAVVLFTNDIITREAFELEFCLRGKVINLRNNL